MSRRLRRSALLATGIAASLLAYATSLSRAECARLDDFLQVLDLHLELDPADWEAIRHDSTFEVERPAEFRCGDEAPLPVRVRRKRSGALPSDAAPLKVSLKIDFDDFVADGEWHGHRKVGLENGIYDPALPSALVREGVAWILMARAGAISGGASWVRLHLNGAPLGVFLRVEEVDKSFLRRRVGEDEGFLYKLDHRSGEVRRRLTRIGEPDPYDAALCFPPFDGACSPPADGLDHLLRHLDIRQILTLGAANTLLANADGYLEADNNYYWYNSERPRLYFPWDLDLSILPWSVDHHPHVSEVEKSLFRVAPTLRSEFDRVLLRLVGDELSRASVDGLIDALEMAIGPALDADPLDGLDGGPTEEFERIRAWLHERGEFLRAHLPPKEPPSVVINEVLASNRGGARDEGGEAADWVELHNRGADEVSLEGLYLSDDPARPLRWPLPPISLAAGAHLLIWCDGDTREGPLHADFRLDADGEAVGLHELRDGIVRALDFVRFGPQSEDASVGRLPDGAPGIRPLGCPTPGASNDTPCPRVAAFLRGDVVSDGRLDLSDAVALLDGLIRGARLACLDASDADDDGAAGVTDAVHLLLHLFGGGGPPSPPFPSCGADGTDDGLDCEDGGACPGNRRATAGGG